MKMLCKQGEMALLSLMDSDAAPGEEFEARVSLLFQALSGATVARRRRISGKSVDILVELSERFDSKRRIAVECKDYAKRLTRAQVSEIMADYWPLIANAAVDEVFLVTREGIVDNAASVFLDNSKAKHYTYSELLRNVVNLLPLAHNMRQQYYVDDLHLYYEPARARYCEIAHVLAKFNLHFSDFMSFAVNEFGDEWIDCPPIGRGQARLELDRAQRLWHGTNRTKHSLIEDLRLPSLNALKELTDDFPDELEEPDFEYAEAETVVHFDDVLESYEPEEFARIMRAFCTTTTSNLEHLVMEYIDEESPGVGLAITGTYGTGKSTFARRLTYQLASAYLAGNTARVPLLIELRRFASDQDIGSLITDALVNEHGVEGANFTRFQLLNRAGLFVLVFDGFDEMKHGMSREALARNFGELSSVLQGRAKVVICGRPTVFSSHEEKARLLGWNYQGVENTSARYVQIELTSWPVETSIEVIRRYAQAKNFGASDLETRLQAIATTININPDLRELLRRPVHIPMLLRILPKLNRNELAELNRGQLYESFIRDTIDRESIKRIGQGDPFTIEQRMTFSATLACEMLDGDDTRSITLSAIPDEVIEEYRQDSVSIETTKRALIASCFLEPKYPDILYFGHKSYCEFLVAWRLLESIRASEDVATCPLTHEVIEFFLDQIVLSDLNILTRSLGRYANLLRVLREHDGFSSRATIARHQLTNLILARATDFCIEKLPADRLYQEAMIFLSCCSTSDYSAQKDVERAVECLASAEDADIAWHALAVMPESSRPTLQALTLYYGENFVSKWRRDGRLDYRILGSSDKFRKPSSPPNNPFKD